MAFAQPTRRGATAGFVDHVHHGGDDIEHLATQGAAFGVEALFQRPCLADHVGQAAQALIDVSVGPVAIAHQPAPEAFAEHLLHDLAATPSDDEQGGRRTGEHPQPQELAVLLPARLVGVQQLDVAHRGEDLLLDHGLERAGRLMHALVDQRRGQRQAEPVAQEFTHLGARQTHPLAEGTDEDHQRRPGQVPFAQRHRPARVRLATPRQRSAPVPAGAASLQVDMLGLLHHQATAPTSGGHQIQHVAGVMRPLLVGIIQEMPADGTTGRGMHRFGIDRELLGAAVPWCTLAPAWATRLLPRSRAIGCALRLRLPRLRFRRSLLAALPRPHRSIRLLPLRLGLLPWRPCARGPRAIGRILRQPLARPLQILDRLAQQRPRLLWRQIPQGGLVKLSEIVIAEVHSGECRRSGNPSSRLSLHIR